MKLGLFFVLALHVVNSSAQDRGLHRGLEATYQFLVTSRDTHGGVLYTATAGELRGLTLPLSFYDSSEYWGTFVCQHQEDCAVTATYNATDYTLTPQNNTAGELQTERINVHNGTNIYDAAAWQIAVVLGQVVNEFGRSDKLDAYALATNQNRLLKAGYSGNALDARSNTNRAVTNGKQFLYNDHVISTAQAAYHFRMIPRTWLSTDPLAGTRFESLLTAKGLPMNNANYQRGKITWTDWKPITGENAWAFLLGPLQAAYLHFIKDKQMKFVPFSDLSVQNALAVLPTFAAMQSQIGAVYYVPTGTLSNQGSQLVNPHQVSVENNASLYAGLKILESTLRAELAAEGGLRKTETDRINVALEMIKTMINGGQHGKDKSTAGLLSFFKTHAWRNGEFVQGGLANDSAEKSNWVAALQPKAIDTNTWSVAALGAKQIDQWFGFGAAYKNWQQLKNWGGYGVGNQLWGAGYSDVDGNGMNADGTYRQGVLSSEWTAGAINMVRNLIAHYAHLPADSINHAKSQVYVQNLTADANAMLAAVETLRADNYDNARFPGKPPNYKDLRFPAATSYLYASKRYYIPFGWYANPIPSTCATAWLLMVIDGFDPFGVGGRPN